MQCRLDGFCCRDPRFPEWKGRFSLVKGDIRDSRDMQDALKDIEVVIHLAAISNDPSAELHPAPGTSARNPR